MKKPSNKAKAIYLIWVLIIFFGISFNQFSSEETLPVIFLLIAPILIYYIITLFKTKNEGDK
jgi:Na+/H+ antiporter NhaD/arsenite permease-like protein